MPAARSKKDAVAPAVLEASRRLNRRLKRLDFAAPVACVYNPLEYAAAAHELYVRRYGDSRKRVLFLGMNPGPFGMAQTGVPFGEIGAVRDWMGIEAKVIKPRPEHPKRPIEGFACARSEVSGARLWGLFAERYPRPADFFKEHFVLNYCPLVFMEASGRNLTPDKLPAAEAAPLLAACDEHLRELVRIFRPELLLGVGKFAARRAAKALAVDAGKPAAKGKPADAVLYQALRIDDILHPSPASPAANRGWAEQATRRLVELGVWKK